MDLVTECEERVLVDAAREQQPQWLTHNPCEWGREHHEAIAVFKRQGGRDSWGSRCGWVNRDSSPLASPRASAPLTLVLSITTRTTGLPTLQGLGLPRPVSCPRP